MRTASSDHAPTIGLAALAAFALAAAGCTEKTAPVPMAPDQSAQPPQVWPPGRSAPLKITDTLILSIPLEYERSAIYHGEPARALIFVQSDRAEAQFDFFLPRFSGYTLQNYQDEFDQNKVEVVYLHAGDPHEAEPDAPGEYPPNMLKRALQDSVNPDDHKDTYGLRCYQGRVPSDRITCYGRREETAREDIMLYASFPPYAAGVTFPLMQARYFSKRYGGVRIAWRTHVSNLSRWREIDTQIWKFIDAWNVVPAPAPSQR
jgi:hypothetical protein